MQPFTPLCTPSVHTRVLALRSPHAAEGTRGHGLLKNQEHKLSAACISPFGGNNGWEGRSAQALA